MLGFIEAYEIWVDRTGSGDTDGLIESVTPRSIDSTAGLAGRAALAAYFLEDLLAPAGATEPPAPARLAREDGEPGHPRTRK